MALKKTVARESNEGQGDFELAPEGEYYAMCVGVIDLGTQEEEYGGEVKEKPKMALVFELLNLAQQNGEPFFFAEKFTVSLAANGNLRPFLKDWLGKTIQDGETMDFGNTSPKAGTVLVGKYALVKVEHLTTKSGKDYAKMVTVAQVPTKLRDDCKTLKPTAPLTVWEVETPELPEFADKVFLFGKSLVDHIVMCKERRGRHPNSNRAPAQPAQVRTGAHGGAVLTPGTGVTPPPKAPSPAALKRQNAAATVPPTEKDDSDIPF
jgi:hypothetical protein